MKGKYIFIFDMDGTLYQFDKGQSSRFTSSQFYIDVRENIYSFLMNRCELSLKEAENEYGKILKKYNGEVSLGVEIEYGIDRYNYFESTWNLSPEKYIQKDSELLVMLEQMAGRIVLLTSAPKVWTDKVLAYLGIESVFEERVYTGEPDLRKPSSKVFQKIADDFTLAPRYLFSIGDQESSDIIPAKSIGMRTILVGGSQNTVADYQVHDVKMVTTLLRKEGYL